MKQKSDKIMKVVVSSIKIKALNKQLSFLDQIYLQKMVCLHKLEQMNIPIEFSIFELV